HLANENGEVLEQIAVNTGDKSMAAACLELAAICKNQLSEEEIIAFMTSDMVATEMANWALGEIWKEVVDVVSGYGIAISVGQSLGKWSSGLLFSTDKEIETYYEMCALYDFENELRKVVSSYANKYKSSKTQENAVLYNTSFELLLKTFELGCDISVTYAEANYDSGLVNLFVSYVFGNHEKYEKYKESLNSIKNEITWLHNFANGDLYNAYRDTYCIDVANEIGMESVTVETEKESVETTLGDLKQNIFACCDVIIEDDLVLSGDMETYGTVYLKSGTVHLNGYTLTIGGDLIQSGGTVKVGGGHLEVGGDYRVQSQNIDSVGDVSYGTASVAYLYMTEGNDYVTVEGNFVMQSNGDNKGKLTAGTMEVKGDFVQKGGNSYNFAASGTHTVILNGTKKQTVSFAHSSSGFNQLDMQNENIEFQTDLYIKGFKATRDIVLDLKGKHEVEINGTLNLNGYKLIADGDLKLKSGEINLNGGSMFVAGNLVSDGTININRGELSVTGNLIEEVGTVKIGGGRLEVGGDYRVQSQNIDSVG
ncbi:MAG: hypothetical protein ACI4C5_08995, partial [Lachnospiraceae bacterium]